MSSYKLLFSGAALCAVLVCGCNNQAKHEDVKDGVKAALKNSNYGDIDVDQDREKGVITLKGNVQNDEQKAQAENLVKASAPGYVIADEIGVRPPGAERVAGDIAEKADDHIENNLKSVIQGNPALKDQSIDVKSKNGTVTLSGTVKTPAQKAAIEAIAKKTPDVQQVVNVIVVKPSKHSTATKPNL